MDFRFGGELPDDHVFFGRVRPLVEGLFKFISWLIITATLGVAAELTSNGWLWSMARDRARAYLKANRRRLVERELRLKQ